MKILKMTILVFAASLLLGACENQGPLEEAGENADEAIEQASENVEDAVDEASNSIEDACEEAKEAAGAEDEDC